MHSIYHRLFFITILFLASNTFAGIDDGLVVHYPFDGNGTDLSGNGHHLTLESRVEPTSDQLGNEGKALHFNIQDLFTAKSSDFNLTDWTYTAWINPDQVILEQQGIFAQQQWRDNIYASSRFFLALRENRVFVGWEGETGTPRISLSSEPIESGEWIFVAVTNDSSKGKLSLYIGVNGEITQSSTNYTGSAPDETGALSIGGTYVPSEEPNGPAYFFIGSINDLRLYNRVLTPQEIDGLYASTYNGLTLFFESDDAFVLRAGRPLDDFEWNGLLVQKAVSLCSDYIIDHYAPSFFLGLWPSLAIEIVEVIQKVLQDASKAGSLIPSVDEPSTDYKTYSTKKDTGELTAWVNLDFLGTWMYQNLDGDQVQWGDHIYIRIRRVEAGIILGEYDRLKILDKKYFGLLEPKKYSYVILPKKEIPTNNLQPNASKVRLYMDLLISGTGENDGDFIMLERKFPYELFLPARKEVMHQCSITQLKYCETKEECETVGGYWYSNTCNRTPENNGTVISAGQVWMDRNLGASRAAVNSTDSLAYGDLYQWGRGTDGHEKRDSALTVQVSNSDTPGHGNFIWNNNQSPYDWRVPQNDTLWQGENGINNPCPSGFRLPTMSEWDAEAKSWAKKNSEGAIISPLKLPASGYRDDTCIQFEGVAGYYWSSTVDGIWAIRFSFNKTSVGNRIMDRQGGRSVRCIKD